MNEYIKDINIMKEWINSKPPNHNLNYAIERVEYFRDELFKLAQFSVGDKIEICKDLNISESSGWYSYCDRLEIGCCGIIVEQDHYNGKFRYSILMDPQKENVSTFTIGEEFLKPKGWDQNKNG